MFLLDERKKNVAELIQIDGFSWQEIYDFISIPQDTEHGDYALPCFRFAKALRKSPIQIAEELKVKIGDREEYEKIEAVSGYLNFKLNRNIVVKSIIEDIVNKGDSFGDSDVGHGKTICMDYSSVNIAKPFHMGHLATTAIGAALYRMYKKMGFTPIGINHLGDWGTQFGKLIVAYKLWGKDKNIEGIHQLNELYVKFHDEAENNKELEEQARLWFKRIEEGDKEALSLFTFFKDITLKEVKKVYERLHVDFDSWDGESFYNDKMDAVLDRLDSLKLTKISNGAKIIDLDEYGMPPCLLVKADGATLYATRDLAAAFYRKKTYNFYKSLYVVAYQQNLHFQQVFKVIELMNEPWYKDLVHVQFGMVSLESGALSTRKGNVIWLEDVLNKAVQRVEEIIIEKNPSIKDIKGTAEKIGVGAVVYSALCTARIKDTVFSYDKVLSFEGETGPYLQYSNTRCVSILKRANFDFDNISKQYKSFSETEIQGITDSYSSELVMLLDKFSHIVFEALEKYEPYILSRYLIDVAKAFNKFYIENRILNATDDHKNSRIALTYATHIVLKNGLALLGIAAPDEM